MATRSNVRLEMDGKVLWLYRHWDGYPAEAGAVVYEIADKLSHHTVYSVEDVANRFFRVIGENGGGEKRCVYELTSEMHGDIDFLYGITIKNKVLSVQFAAKPSDWSIREDWEPDLQAISLDDLKSIVNRDRKTINARIEEMKQQTPRASEYQLYPMIA